MVRLQSGESEMKATSIVTVAIALCLAALGSLAAPAFAQSKSHLQRVLETGTLRVGTTGDYNPMTIFDPQTKEYRGFEIDAARMLGGDLGGTGEFVPTDLKTLVAGVSPD